MKQSKRWVGLGICALWVMLISMAWSGEENVMHNESEKVVRKAHGAGRWFPGRSRELREMVDTYVAQAKVPDVKGVIVAALAPHAGYPYSGGMAGYTFRAIKDNAEKGHAPDLAVVLGLSHRGGFNGVALMSGDAIETPLRQSPLDTEAGEFLADASPRIFFDYAPHAGEHSAENEIPFVQATLPGVKMVVGLIGDHDPRTISELADALNALNKNKRIVVIASTDMLHDPDYDRVTNTDKATLEKVAQMDDAGLAQEWRPSKQIFCGIAPVLTAMRFAKDQGCEKGTILGYCNSGDDFPESRGRWVVGYGAVIFAVPE
ncbi:MAG: AmmeMemoRadiSam system protein B [Deltaproteobacteria bacterium]|nr:AmmeMemoRadiSam system protein B [Deltaproteobacteria bacterium]